jgi:hypothetical protein
MKQKRNQEKTRQKEYHDLHSSPNIIRLIKLRRMRWAEQVALTGQRRRF